MRLGPNQARLHARSESSCARAAASSVELGSAQTRRLATHVFARSAAPRQLTLDAVSEKGSEPVYYPAPEVNVSFGLGDSLLAEY